MMIPELAASSDFEQSTLIQGGVHPRERGLVIELRSGLPADAIDGELVRASRGQNVTNRILAYYLDELHESRKFRDLGYSCLAQYADHRLGIEPRRARELCQAGRALTVLSRIDRAFLDGVLSWTKTELLTHGVGEHEQDEWIERAQGVSCVELRQLLTRHRKGLSIEGDRDGGLPQTEIALQAFFSGDAYAKIEATREDLMRRRGVYVDDSEVLNYIVGKHELPVLPERDAKREAELAAASEQKVTPDWLRKKVLARDGYRCRACGRSESLHAHHVVFRSQGGVTREENLAAVCAACHGLIHEGRVLARGSVEEGLEFHNRFGEPLRREGQTDGALPRAVLRVLRDCVPTERATRSGCGGRPPLPKPPRPALDLDCSSVPDHEMGAWFKARMHLFEPGRDGVWRPKKSGGQRAS